MATLGPAHCSGGFNPPDPNPVYLELTPGAGLYKILFYFKALLWELIILLLPLPPAKPTLLQYYCTTIAQYTTPPVTSRVYAIYHAILGMATSCEGRPRGLPASLMSLATAELEVTVCGPSSFT